MPKQNFFNGKDLFRICRVMDIYDEEDYGYICAGISLLLARITRFYNGRYKDDNLFSIQIDPVHHGINLYLADDNNWSHKRKYRKSWKLLQEIARQEDYKTVTDYLIDNIEKLAIFTGL